MPGDGREYSFTNPYDDFMKKHLSHYGYYTGRNSNYRASLLFNEYNRNHGYRLSDSDQEVVTHDDSNDNDDANQERLRSNQLVLSLESGKVVPKLKEPRGLFPAANPAAGPSQAARWPAEIEVIDEEIKHIQTVPKAFEPFYVRTGQEQRPTLQSLESGTTVYQLNNRQCPFFVHSRVGGSRQELSEITPNINTTDDNTLIFESRFESGNLERAVKVSANSYELWLSNDLYTNKHTQWFYFRVQNTRSNVKYRFTICNFMKSNSLYNDGMKPCFYSEKEAQHHKTGWKRQGEDIIYYRSNYNYATGKGERPYYALTFTFTCKYDHDTVYLAHCYPYTYSDLQDYLKCIVEDDRKSKLCRLRILTRSLAGNLVYLLSITSPYDENQIKQNSSKKAVVITARVHPGETNGSWMMKGFLDFLLSDAPDAKLLRDTFVFKIVPMLNPDGVIVGNYRCSLAGRDLNRNYKSRLVDSYPTIMSTKNMMKRLVMEREVIMYCDLHGHSRKQNVFMYGCENRSNPNKRLHERIFPAMLHKNAPEKFLFSECNFKVQKNKEGCGRIVMWNLGITNSFTMEATFCGSGVGKSKSSHFSTKDFESMGYHFCDTLLDYCDPDQTKYEYVLSELKNELKIQILSQFARLGRSSVTLNGKQVDLTDPNLNVDELMQVAQDISSDDGGSDSSVSDGLPVNIEYMQHKNPPKKKKLTKKERDQIRRQPPLNTASRASSAKSRHENCHHNHKTERQRKCLSAKRTRSGSARPIESKVMFKDAGDQFGNGEETNDVTDNQRAYLKSLTEAMNKQDDSQATGKSNKKGHLRYTNSTNRPLAMNVDNLAERSQSSFAAQYLLNRIQSVNKPEFEANNRSKRETPSQIDDKLDARNNELLVQFYNQQKEEQAQAYSEYSDLPYEVRHEHERMRLTYGSRLHQTIPKATEYHATDSQPKHTHNWSFRQPPSAHTRHRGSDDTPPRSAISRRQHPLPFEQINKPSSVILPAIGFRNSYHFGEGQADSAAIPSALVTQRPPTRSPAIIQQKCSSNSLVSVDGAARNNGTKHHTTETVQHQANHQPTNISNIKPIDSKYLEKMVADTDRDIEFLRAEIQDMQQQDGVRHENNTILELARQRRMATVDVSLKEHPINRQTSASFHQVKEHAAASHSNSNNNNNETQHSSCNNNQTSCNNNNQTSYSGGPYSERAQRWVEHEGSAPTQGVNFNAVKPNNQIQTTHYIEVGSRRGFTGGIAAKTNRRSNNLSMNQVKQGLFSLSSDSHEPKETENRKVPNNQARDSANHKNRDTASSVPRVSVHMSSHPVPSAPKVNRRVQVRMVPPSIQRDERKS